MSLTEYRQTFRSTGQYATGIDAVLEAVRKQEKRLDLASKGVTAAGLDVLVAASVARSLTFLDLSSNRLGNVGVKILSENLLGRSGPSSPIQALHLRDCFIGPEGAFALASALPSAPSLQLLDISDNMLQSRGVARLADALPACSNLAHFSADSCYALSAGTSALARGALACAKLAHLSVANNHPGDAGYCALAELIKSSPTLHCLDASGQAVGHGRTCCASWQGPRAPPRGGHQDAQDQTQEAHASTSFDLSSAVDRSMMGGASTSVSGHLAASHSVPSSALTTVMGETVFAHRRSGLAQNTLQALADGLRAAVSTQVVHLRGLHIGHSGMLVLLQAVTGNPAEQQVGTLQELHLDHNPVNPVHATKCGEAALGAASSNWRLCRVSLLQCGLQEEHLRQLENQLVRNTHRRQEAKANSGIQAAIEAEQQRVAELSSTLAAEHAATTHSRVQLDMLRQSHSQLQDTLHQQGNSTDAASHDESKQGATGADASSSRSHTDSLHSALELVETATGNAAVHFPGADPLLVRQLHDLRVTRAQLQDSVPRASAAASSAHAAMHGAQEEVSSLQSAVAVARARREAMLREQRELEGEIAHLRRQQQEAEESMAASQARDEAARSAAVALKAELHAMQDSIAAGHAELRAMRATRLSMAQDILPAIHASEAAARRAAAASAQLEADLRGRLASTAALAEAVQHQVANERHRMTMLPKEEPVASPTPSAQLATRTILVSPRSDAPSSPPPQSVPRLPLQLQGAANETIMPEEDKPEPPEALQSPPHLAETAVGPDSPPPADSPAPAAPAVPDATLPECLGDLVDTEGSALTVHCGLALRSSDELQMGSVTVHSVAWPPVQSLRRESDGQPWSPDGRDHDDTASEGEEPSGAVVVDLRGLYQFGVSPWDALLELRVVTGAYLSPRSTTAAGSRASSPATMGSPTSSHTRSRVSILTSWIASIRVYTGDVTTIALQCALVLPEVPSTIRLQVKNPDSAVALLQALLMHVPERLHRSVQEALCILDPPSPATDGQEEHDRSPTGSAEGPAQGEQETETHEAGGSTPQEPSMQSDVQDELQSVQSDTSHLQAAAPTVEVAPAMSPQPATVHSPGFVPVAHVHSDDPAGHGSIDAPQFPSAASTPHANAPYTPFSDEKRAHRPDNAAMHSPAPAATTSGNTDNIVQARPPVTGFVLTEPPGWGQHNPVSYSPRYSEASGGSKGEQEGGGSTEEPNATQESSVTGHVVGVGEGDTAPPVLNAAAVPRPPEDASPIAVASIRDYTWKMLKELWAAQTLPKYGELRKHVARQLNFGGGVLKGKEWRVWFRATVDDLLATLYAQTEEAEAM